MKLRVYFLIGIFIAQQSCCMETQQSPRNIVSSSSIMPQQVAVAFALAELKRPYLDRVKRIHDTKHIEVSLANTLDLIKTMKEPGSLKTVTFKQPIVDNE